VVEERLARAVKEPLLTGRVQVAQLALQCLVVQLMRIKDPRCSRRFPPTTSATTSAGRPEQAWMLNFRVRDLDAIGPAGCTTRWVA
jgi:hypothetical protein